MFKVLKENMKKKLKKIRRKMYQKVLNINKEIEIIKKKNQMEILELKSIVTEKIQQRDLTTYLIREK